MSEFENFVDLGANELKKFRDKQSKAIEKINKSSKSLYVFSFIVGLIVAYPIRNIMLLDDRILVAIFVNLIYINMAFIIAILIIVPFEKMKENIVLDDLRNSFKSKLIQAIIKEISPNLNHNEKEFIRFKEFDKPMIYKEYFLHTYFGNDLIYGKIDGVGIKFSDVYYSKNSVKLESYPIFQGILFIADFNKFFKSRVIVLDKKDYYAKCVLNKTKMDNSEFNEFFDTYCFDEINARYILSPILMEKLVALRKTFDTTCNICFMANQIYIYINLGYDSFEEFDYSKPMVGENSIAKKYKEEITQFLDIVKDLNLNSKVFKPYFGESITQKSFILQEFKKSQSNFKSEKTAEAIQKARQKRYTDNILTALFLLSFGFLFSVIAGGFKGFIFFIFFAICIWLIYFIVRATDSDNETENK